MKVNQPDIKYLFKPRSIAIIGASSDKNKIGYQIIDNIKHSKFPGKVYPVNPKGGKILGFKINKSMQEINSDVDIACIAIPAKYTFEAVESCAEKNVKFLVIITSGFSEIGNIEEERKIVNYAHKHGMRVLGPNIFGIYTSIAPINASFGPREVIPGNVALITQSGAIGVAMFGKTKSENIGLSTVISVGNKSDIDEADLLEYLTSHKDTKVILMYIEGVKHGDKLVSILKNTTPVKPVIVIKSGSSKRGAMAAASHTGSLAGADEIFSDIMRQCGVLRAESIEEALIWCKFLSNTPVPKGENTIIITNGGGMGVMAADACEKYGVNLYDDINVMKKYFSNVVPEFGSLKNPIDLTGPATLPDYESALNIAMKNRNIHSIICLGCETAGFEVKRFPKLINKIYLKNKSTKPIIFSFLGGLEIEETIHSLRQQGVPIFSEVYDAISCFGAMYFNYHNLRSRVEIVDKSKKIIINIREIKNIIKKVKDDNRNFLLSPEAAGVMNASGIQMPQSYIAQNIDEAVEYSTKLGYPVVMKIVSKDIIHKSDAGGVALDLDNKAEVLDAFQAILQNCRRYKPEAKITGIEVAEMIPEGTETIIGARRDKSFGPIVMFGLGGIYVEVMKDVSFRALPLTRREARSMIKEIKSYPLLLGVRGESRKDINSIVDSIIRLGEILLECENISDIEINPLVVYEEGQGAKAVDARILISTV